MKAVEQGDAEGQCHVAKLHFTDSGAFGDYGKAVEYAKLAVAQGHEGAKEFLKTIESVNQVQGKPDSNSMIGQFMPAALRGDAKAQTLVGCYLEMDGNDEEAMVWYEKAAAQGDEMAAAQLMSMKNDGSEGCEKAKQKLTNFIERKANLGYNSPQEKARLKKNLATIRQSAETIKNGEEQLLGLLKTHFSKEVALQKLEEDAFDLPRQTTLALRKRVQLLPDSEFESEKREKLEQIMRISSLDIGKDIQLLSERVQRLTEQLQLTSDSATVVNDTAEQLRLASNNTTVVNDKAASE
jgi:hypothetical protein